MQSDIGLKWSLLVLGYRRLSLDHSGSPSCGFLVLWRQNRIPTPHPPPAPLCFSLKNLGVWKVNEWWFLLRLIGDMSSVGMLAAPFRLLYKRTLRKHAYSNILKILPPKNENFQIKKSDIFHISAQNINCGYSLEPPRRGGSNEYPQSMFLSRHKKNNVHLCKPQFYYIKVRFKGVKII